MKHLVFASKTTANGKFVNYVLTIHGAKEACRYALHLRKLGFYSYMELA